MKKLLFLVMVGFTQLSCFKSDNRDLGIYNTTDGYIRYQVNNFSYEINGGYGAFSSTGVGVYARKQLKSSSITATRYLIFGQLSPRTYISIVIVTDSLTTGLYKTSNSLNALTTVKVDSSQYASNRAEDVLNLDITKNAAGVIEGTFSGKLSEPKSDNSSTLFTEAIVTNGSFKNVKIGY